MVETPRSSAEDLSTSNEAIYWTEHNPNSKLKEIKQLVKWSNNEKIQQLDDLLTNKEYKKFQKEIWITWTKSLDGKLWTNTLTMAKTHINKEKAVDTVKDETDALKTSYQDAISEWFRQGAELNNAWVKNTTKRRWERWNSSLKKYEAYEEEVWFVLKWKKLDLKHLYIFAENNIYEEINDTLNDVSISFMWKNIIINSKYVLSPEWTMCRYSDRANIDTWTQQEFNTAHRGLISPLYDYLVKNKNTYERWYTVVADGSGIHNNHFDNPRQTRRDNSEVDYSDVGMHKEVDKDWNTVWVSDRIRP